MRFVLILLAALAAVSARADADVTLNWTAPTHCTNGEELGTGACPQLTRFTLHCGDQGGPWSHYWGIDAFDDAGQLQTSDTRSYPDGVYYCALKARNSADLNNGFSEYSNEITFTVETAPPTPDVPNPPTSITIQVQAAQ